MTTDGAGSGSAEAATRALRVGLVAARPEDAVGLRAAVGAEVEVVDLGGAAYHAPGAHPAESRLTPEPAVVLVVWTAEVERGAELITRAALPAVAVLPAATAEAVGSYLDAGAEALVLWHGPGDGQWLREPVSAAAARAGLVLDPEVVAVLLELLAPLDEPPLDEPPPATAAPPRRAGGPRSLPRFRCAR